MAKQRTISEEAKIENEDLTATLSYIPTSYDGYGAPIKELAFALQVQHVSGTQGGYGRVIVDDVLTAQERSDLNPLLVKLRNAALLAAGYIDV